MNKTKFNGGKKMQDYQNNDGIEQKAEGRNKNEPIIETQISKSKDGRWVIHKTIITDIKPVTYFEQVVKSQARQTR
jgi:hypothetical protein